MYSNTNIFTQIVVRVIIGLGTLFTSSIYISYDSDNEVNKTDLELTPWRLSLFWSTVLTK